MTFHPYRNMSVAKAALERITIELADELGRSRGIRVNALRFSPYLGSKAGTATLEPSDVEKAESMSPLGNAGLATSPSRSSTSCSRVCASPVKSATSTAATTSPADPDQEAQRIWSTAK